jgi:PAS domain S-box-containing protein
MKLLFQQKALKEVRSGLERQLEQAKKASAFIKEIEKGNLAIDVSEELLDSELGASLASIKNHLAKLSQEEHERNWLNVGLAKFADILRNKESLDLQRLSDDILSNLIKYVEANQGALFVLEGEGDDAYLDMIACYAYDRKKYVSNKVNLGEGLVGQCVLERETIYMTQTPAGYVKITSGLGQAAPKSILISPLLINEKVFGVLELASFHEFPAHKIDFIRKLSENIAASIKHVKESERILSLLSASQQQAEEMRAQEEEMRQNMEELQATQEEMQRKSDALNKASAEMMSILNGINATMATIEFTPDGHILHANSIFLRTMNYRLEEITGMHHRKFVPNDILHSNEYKTFWNRLAAGESIKGVFKRLSQDGQIKWLNAIYNPILDAAGNVIKIVKFATDITHEQEMMAESKGVIEGINATMAIIEFTPHGTVLTANENFLRTMEYRLEDIAGHHHHKLVPEDIRVQDDYRTFWRDLAAGKATKGVFRRLTASGKTVWLNAIYNPILNANGEVVKVTKFATEVVKATEMAAA